MKAALSTLLCFICFQLHSQVLTAQEKTSAPTHVKGFDKVGEATGGLDKEGIPEKVVVYNTDHMTDDGYVRELHIYKRKGDNWEVWQTSESAVRKSKQGGMMGDPFEGVVIEKGILKVYHFGGSSWKWSDTHLYRYQKGEFYLIGLTSVYGKPCEYWSSFDYNLSTGKIIYKKEFENCEVEAAEPVIAKVEKEEFTHKLSELPKLTNIGHGSHKIVSPGLNVELYF